MSNFSILNSKKEVVTNLQLCYIINKEEQPPTGGLTSRSENRITTLYLGQSYRVVFLCIKDSFSLQYQINKSQ